MFLFRQKLFSKYYCIYKYIINTDKQIELKLIENKTKLMEISVYTNSSFGINNVVIEKATTVLSI